MHWFMILLFVLPGVFQFPAYSERADTDPKEEVEKVITDFFDAMRQSDSADMELFLTADATLKTVASGNQDNTILRETEIPAFLNSIEESDVGSLDEQLTSLIAHVDAKLSTAWMEYRFYYNGEFSHCGVNTMNLIQTAGGWKIFSIVDTRRQDPC